MCRALPAPLLVPALLVPALLMAESPARAERLAAPSTISYRNTKTASLKSPPKTASLQQPKDRRPFRGWSFLVERLRAAGVSDAQLRSVYEDQRMPAFEDIDFAVAPREGQHLYNHFLSEKKVNEARLFLDQHRSVFAAAEKIHKVDRSIVAALLLIETGYGKNTGKELIINRLSRLAGLAEPKNVERNYERLHDEDPTVKLEAVKARAQYLYDTFMPEIVALFELARLEKVDVFTLRGSSAGAFGIPQFLPSTFLRFAVDGNRDGKVSLFQIADAVASTAHYLSRSGWKDHATREERYEAVWKYNHSEAYVETALKLADRLR